MYVYVYMDLFSLNMLTASMSGGERKKRSSRTTGWEEAGGEFYQESYPGDVDLEVLQRDPHHIATLLPSKQSRGGMTTYTELKYVSF